MGPKSATKGRPRRTHSLGGCATCRRRHVKCDQVQPRCLTCKAVGVICEGYSSRVKWVTASVSGEDSRTSEGINATRRHLYTEESRASMSYELASNLTLNSVDASLTEIDSWSKNDQSLTCSDLAVGPFRVLNFNAPTKSPSTTRETAKFDGDPPAAAENPAEELFSTPSTLDLLMGLDNSLQWADLFALDFGTEFSMQQSPTGPIVPELVPALDTSPNVAFDATCISNAHPSRTNGDRNLLANVSSIANKTPVSLLLDTSSPSASLLGDAQLLLSHFQDKVVDAMAGVPWTEKSPWKILNVACAVQTLAHMTYLGDTIVKHANAANLYSVMSCAARHLSNGPKKATAENWHSMADWALNKAKFHVEQTMHHEFLGCGRAKYKDQLMAVMGTMTACQLAGNQSDVRRYMLESEKVLRLRGLAKREISRKARLLHHMYTWARIMGESTYVLHDYQSYAPIVQGLNIHRQQKTAHQDQAEHRIYSSTRSDSHTSKSRLDDFLRIETQHDSELDIDERKEAEVGLHDIHLEDARDDPASMYSQIYGISETWLSLLSQTTRLANVMDILQASGGDSSIPTQTTLQKRASRLENMVCSFASRGITTGAGSRTTDSAQGSSNRLPNTYMVQALNSALVIFFYRRIRDVNPWILRSHVDDVVRALREYDRALAEHGISGPGTAWPAFIAGCEATTAEGRNTLLEWIQRGRAKSGMHSYRAAEEVLTEVWTRKDAADNKPSSQQTRPVRSTRHSSRVSHTQCSSWVNISRERKIWLMLS